MPRRPRKRTYGDGSVSRDGDRWRIRWRQEGRRRSETFPEHALAVARLRIVTGELARGRAGKERDPKSVPTLAELGDIWFDAREGPANRNNANERRKWKNHLKPALGHLRPDEVTSTHLRTLIREKLATGRMRSTARHKKGAAGLSSTTVLQVLRILSSLFSSLIEDGHATRNPVRELPRDSKRKMRPSYDWRNTPYLARLEDAARIYAHLPAPINVAFAIGVMRGPRPGEIRALRWPAVDLEQRLLHVRTTITANREGPPKGGRTRTLTISSELYAVLAPWRLLNPGEGLVIPHRRPRHKKARFISERALNKALAPVLVKLGLPMLTWYQATRHTFASHFVLQGGSLESLASILGHATTAVTARYAHLQAHHLRPEDTARAQVALAGTRGHVIQAEFGTSTDREANHERTKTG